MKKLFWKQIKIIVERFFWGFRMGGKKHWRWIKRIKTTKLGSVEARLKDADKHKEEFKAKGKGWVYYGKNQLSKVNYRKTRWRPNIRSKIWNAKLSITINELPLEENHQSKITRSFHAVFRKTENISKHGSKIEKPWRMPPKTAENQDDPFPLARTWKQNWMFCLKF